MAHAITETIARPASSIVGRISLLGQNEAELIDAHSAHSQEKQDSDDEVQDPRPEVVHFDNPGVLRGKFDGISGPLMLPEP